MSAYQTREEPQQSSPPQSKVGQDKNKQSASLVSATERFTKIRVSDFQHHKNSKLILGNKDFNANDTLLSGVFYNQELTPGLNLHVGNMTEEYAFTVEGIQHPGLSCIFVIKGNIEVTFGNQPFALSGDNYSTISAIGMYKRQQERFQRKTRQRQEVNHLVISATPEWLADNELDCLLNRRCAQQSMAFQQWQANTHQSELVKGFFSPAVTSPALLNLQRQARSLDIITETIRMMNEEAVGYTVSAATSRYDRTRFQRAIDFINSYPAQELSVHNIARQAGVSPTGLQKLFRQLQGCSVIEYVRQTRLDEALHALKAGAASVKEISAIAGYKNPANFATAFKRQFGITPKQAITHQPIIRALS